MKRFKFKVFTGILTAFAFDLVVLMTPIQAQAYQEAALQSDVVVTVTYSDPINVRGGPNTVSYPIVGRVFPGDVLPALGVSPGREWIQVAFPDAPGGVGWVYAAYVSISGGELRVVEPPPTPAPLATATVDPTLAAAFVFQPTPTRMPTFTPPPPLEIPKFSDADTPRPSGLPSGLIVASLLLIGAIGLVASFVLRNQ
jgi:uncharacterized protein YraI